MLRCLRQRLPHALPGSISVPACPNINPATGLSTDYLNHFTEALMVLEMVRDMPECIDDLRAWQPKTYTEHFAGSRLQQPRRDRPHV